MLVFKLGQESQPIDVIDVLKKEHDQNQEAIALVIEKRKKAGIPLSDADQQELMLSDFNERELAELKDVRVVFKAVSTLEVIQVQSKLGKAFELKDPIRAEIDGNKAIVDFLKKSVVRVDGLQDAETELDLDGVFNDDLANVLIENRCLMAIYRACRVWQELTASEKKTLEQLLQ